MKPTILIAGDTGATGSAATKFLLEKGFPVRVLVHTDGEQAQKLQAQGADLFISRAPGITKNDSSSTAKDGGFSTDQWLCCSTFGATAHV
jgi:NADPH:quinone reductase-like Zn-dependent oxidoreductase